MKPRVMSLVLFTCAVGLLISPSTVSFTTADQLFSGVYAINHKNVADDSGGTYATPVKGPDAIEIIDTATTNRHPSAVDGGIGCVNVDGTTGNCK